MRKTILAIVLAASAMGVATTASEAGYRSHGYSNSYTYYQPSYDYQPTYSYTPSYSYSYEPSYSYQPSYRHHRRSYSYGGY